MSECAICGSNVRITKYKLINKKTKVIYLCIEHKNYYTCKLCSERQNLGEREILPAEGDNRKRYILLCKTHLEEFQQYSIKETMKEMKSLRIMLRRGKKAPFQKINLTVVQPKKKKRSTT